MVKIVLWLGLIKTSLGLGMCQLPSCIDFKHYQVRIDKWKETNQTSVRANTYYSQISYFHICPLKFICKPKINIHRAFAVICRHVHAHAQSSEKFESPINMFPAEVEQGDILPSCFRSHTVKNPMVYLMPHICFIFSNFTFFVWLPNIVPWCCLVCLSLRRLWYALCEKKNVLYKLCSCMSYSAIGH